MPWSVFGIMGSFLKFIQSINSRKSICMHARILSTAIAILSFVCVEKQLSAASLSEVKESVETEVILGKGVVEKIPGNSDIFSDLPFVIETKRLMIAPTLTAEMRLQMTKLLVHSNPNALTTIFKFEQDEGFTFDELITWFKDRYLAFPGGHEHRFAAYYKHEAGLFPVGILALEKLQDKDLIGASTCLYISESYENRGFGTELYGAIFKWMLKRTNFSYIETNVLPTNIGSVKICKKFGLLKVRSEKEKYLEDFADSSFKFLSDKEQDAIYDAVMNLKRVDVDYYRLNLKKLRD